VSDRQDLARVIAKKSKKDSSKTIAKSVASYLLEKGQVNTLESLLRDVQALRENEGHIEADVYTAHDLSDADLKDVKALVKQEFPDAKTINLYQIHDETVVGGLKIKTANKQLDLTIRAKLDKFKQLTAEETN
jgi:F0F1-type ATP synthase delta subunit